MAVYPAGVKQYFRSELTVDDGKVTAVNRPCVVKSISSAPCSSKETGFEVGPSLCLEVYDGDDIIVVMAGSALANYLCTNSSILIPADGLRINNYLAVRCNQIVSGSGTGTMNKQVNIRVAYQ
tara:strand:+ start:4307 stop:4675 length:369 start_codon:yes stop_codon:yes gene_type:complete